MNWLNGNSLTLIRKDWILRRRSSDAKRKVRNSFFLVFPSDAILEDFLCGEVFFKRLRSGLKGGMGGSLASEVD